MYVFAYGSLLSHRSAAATIPGLRTGECIPSRLHGHVRSFDVAFPNDGSQPDKAFVSADGSRPEVVLFANIRPHPGGRAVNGVLMPIDAGDLGRLIDRERRYDLVDVTDRVRPYPSWAAPERPVVAFAGRPEFTDAAAVRGGVLGTDYLGTILAGVLDWEGRCAGFRDDFAESTRTPPPDRIVPLSRVDGPTSTPVPLADLPG